MSFLRRFLGRALLSGIFIYSGYGMIENADRYAKVASKALPMLPEEPMLPKVHGATMVVAGGALALGILPKLSARVLALALIVNTYVGHAFWKAETPEERRPQLIHFLKNLGLLGGLLYVTGDRRRKVEQPD
jgi:putative oxidoreductase